MNIHPIFVHFPVALLSIYVVLECIWSQRIKDSDSMLHTKVILLFFGVLGAYASLATGDFGEREFASMRNVIHVHESFASATTFIFSVLLGSYLIKLWGNRVSQTATTLVNKVFSKSVVVMLSIAGLLVLLITGTLGGIIVYGPNADFFTNLLYRIMF
ncbi:MAG: DUF2231 domain-containing protein [Minisyncoccia bacterium]